MEGGVDVFNQDGIYVERWNFSNGSTEMDVAQIFHKPIFKGRFVYAVVVNSDGVKQVKKYKIVPVH